MREPYPIDRYICQGQYVKRMVSRRLVLPIALLVTYCIAAQCSYAVGQGPIGVLYIGRVGGWGQPFWLMRPDPLFSFGFVQAEFRTDFSVATPIQAADTWDAVRRMVRIYMPRTYSDLTSRYDVVLFWHANRDAVGPRNNELLARGVKEGGIGILMTGGWESFGGSSFGPAWGETPIGRLLPTEDVIGGWIDDGQLYVDKPDNEFISSLPWKPTPYFNVRGTCHHNIVNVKPGADQLLHLENRVHPDHPGMVTWRIEGARTIAFTVEIFHFYQWEYFIDFGANLIIYADGRPVPQDLELVHRVRGRILEIATRRSLLLSLVEFCESFGANTEPLMMLIDDVEEAIAEATPKYLELRFEEVWETYLKVDEMVKDVERAAVEVKNKALFWIYLVEWLIVTGTLMVSGFILRTIMIRRRLYKEVRTTRLDLVKKMVG